VAFSAGGDGGGRWPELPAAQSAHVVCASQGGISEKLAAGAAMAKTMTPLTAQERVRACTCRYSGKQITEPTIVADHPNLS
jgi:hypothetical protein